MGPPPLEELLLPPLDDGLDRQCLLTVDPGATIHILAQQCEVVVIAEQVRELVR